MDPGELILVFALMKLSKIFNVIFKWGKERTKKQTNKTKCPRPMKVTTCPYGRGSTRLKIELLSPQAGPDRGLGPLGRVSCSWSRAVFEEPQGGMGPPVKQAPLPIQKMLPRPILSAPPFSITGPLSRPVGGSPAQCFLGLP